MSGKLLGSAGEGTVQHGHPWRYCRIRDFCLQMFTSKHGPSFLARAVKHPFPSQPITAVLGTPDPNRGRSLIGNLPSDQRFATPSRGGTKRVANYFSQLRKA